ncbi:MAG TPA: helix-turn-helix domain-containing protein [Candidatus Thermoplasmatota archaeon]|nr:helix-turn-helix domain-containing protein [Candidatus Thermoplasmatota archaeon]
MDGNGSIEIVDSLTAIGLDEREAKLYVDLLLQGASRASDAAARVKLKRTETYRALEALMKRGFVTARLTKPVEYEASPPEAVFADLLARHEERREAMERLRETVGRVAAEARGRHAAPGGRFGYRIIQGRGAILSAVSSIVRHAQERLTMASAHFSPAVATPQNRAYQMLTRRVDDGVALELLVRDHPDFERVLGPLAAHPHARIRTRALPRGARFLIVDGKEIVYWMLSDTASGVEAREDVAMWTNATDFIEAQRALFDALWADAAPWAPRVPARA